MAKQSIAFDTAIANEKPSLIEFYANWCTSCQALAPTLDKLHQKYKENINFVALDIDDTRWQSIASQYRVFGIPYLVFLTSDRQVKKTLVGQTPELVIDREITSLLE